MGRHHPLPPDGEVALPGSAGEHALQRRVGSRDRADRFYRQQVLERLNERMVEFIGRQEMVWIATADGRGECDCSFRAGPPGFVQVLDPPDDALPGVPGQRRHGLARQPAGEPPHRHGLPRLRPRADRPARQRQRPDRRGRGGRRERPQVERWVEVRVLEAYIHGRKHLPHLVKAAGQARPWGTDDARAKGGDYFGASCGPRPWVAG